MLSQDRATAMACCETFAAGLMGMLGPMLGAFVVTLFGGISSTGIRPLYFIAFFGTLGSFFLIQNQLSNKRWGTPDRMKPSFFRDVSQVFNQGRSLRGFIVISSITYLPMGMTIPFAQVFAREIKGADQYILGAMVTGFALSPFVFGIPVGRLADKIGRKKVLLLIAPIFWLSNLMLIWAPGPGFLVVSGILQGFFHMNIVLTAAMAFELVPPEQMGRWVGTLRFFRMMLSAIFALVAGVIWDIVGPPYLFLAFLGIDIFVRIPSLIRMPETLGLKGRVAQPREKG